MNFSWCAFLGLKQQMLLGITKRPPDGLTPREQLAAIHDVVSELLQQAMRLLARQPIPPTSRSRHSNFELRRVQKTASKAS